MPYYALVKEKIVDNVFVCSDDETANSLFDDGVVINIEGVSAGIGWEYDEGVFTPVKVSSMGDALNNDNLLVAQSEYERASSMTMIINDKIFDEDWSDGTELELKVQMSEWVIYRKELRSYLRLGNGFAEIPMPPDTV